MAELTGSYSKDYGGLTESKRRSYLVQLLDIIVSHAYRKFGVVIVNDWFEHEVDQEIRELSMRPNQYVMGGGMCAQIKGWLTGWQKKKCRCHNWS